MGEKTTQLQKSRMRLKNRRKHFQKGSDALRRRSTESTNQNSLFGRNCIGLGKKGEQGISRGKKKLKDEVKIPLWGPLERVKI